MKARSDIPWTTTSRGRDSSRFPMSAMRKGRKSVSPVLPSGQVPEALTTKRLRPAKFRIAVEPLYCFVCFDKDLIF
ncbi:hypothetical protein OUZ56_032187 [Daphnia magna]|uniref:Uncharacterized protein n=1 Tax=Daphnia magna TaxID=35525 RepID=A0ABQ9ZWF2_9CRUS|nr:hypothetical protein OUZ56_032187 [Daphnia magna]